MLRLMLMCTETRRCPKATLTLKHKVASCCCDRHPTTVASRVQLLGGAASVAVAWVAWVPAPVLRSAWVAVCSEARCSARRWAAETAEMVAVAVVEVGAAAAADAVAAAAVELAGHARCMSSLSLISVRAMVYFASFGPTRLVPQPPKRTN